MFESNEKFLNFFLVPGGAPAAGPGGPNEDEKVSCLIKDIIGILWAKPAFLMLYKHQISIFLQLTNLYDFSLSG